MGDGTAMGFVYPKQEGVIAKDRDNFPHIPEKLLRMSPQEILNLTDKVSKAHESNRTRLVPNLKTEQELEDALCILDFAYTAVERQRKSTERE